MLPACHLLAISEHAGTKEPGRVELPRRCPWPAASSDLIFSNFHSNYRSVKVQTLSGTLPYHTFFQGGGQRRGIRNDSTVHWTRGAKMSYRCRLLTRFVTFFLLEPEQREPGNTGRQSAPGWQAGWLWPMVTGMASR